MPSSKNPAAPQLLGIMKGHAFDAPKAQSIRAFSFTDRVS